MEMAVTLPYVSAEDTTNLAPYATTFTASDAFAAVKVVKYHYGAAYGSFATDPAYAGQSASVIKVGMLSSNQ